jgi:signal transduction histidine kinase
MRLFTRTILFYIVFSVFAFLIGGVIFYHQLNRIFDRRIDEDLRTEKLLIQEEISHFDSMPDYQSVYGHLLQIRLYDQPRKYLEVMQDTVMFDMKLEDFRMYRHLKVESMTEDGKGYCINLFKPLDSKRLLTESIVFLILVLFLSLSGFLIFFNFAFLRRIWFPFYRTLGALKQYDINAQTPLHLTGTRIREFRMLNETLRKMSDKILKDYGNLKEFNENASHELQTPLAVIKSKLDLLIQDEKLDETELTLIRSIYEATNRMTRLNQGLLFISRIENNQYNQTGEIEIQSLIESSLENFKEMIEMQGISVTRNYMGSYKLTMNHTLAEIMINNLLSNAIRHNFKEGQIIIRIDDTRFSIKNTGPALQVEPDLLFQRFRKSDNRHDSIGLGLSIVQRICQLYLLKISYRTEGALHILEISR